MMIMMTTMMRDSTKRYVEHIHSITHASHLTQTCFCSGLLSRPWQR